MDKRKELINEYKQRKIIGGIYRLTNTRNGMYFLDHATDLKAKQNSFNFMASSGSCFHFKLQKDWQEYGGSVFVFDTLEEIEKKKEQSQQEFLDDLETLQQIWSEKLPASNRY